MPIIGVVASLVIDLNIVGGQDGLAGQENAFPIRICLIYFRTADTKSRLVFLGLVRVSLIGRTALV